MQTIAHKSHVTPIGVAQTAAAVVAGALGVALTSQLRIDLGFTPVPVTLQVFGVIMAALTLGPRIATGSMALYLGAGMLGAPVFSGGAGGLGYLFAISRGVFAPTLGYLAAFPFAAWVAGTVWEHRPATALQYAWLAGVSGTAIIHSGGFLWLAVQTTCEAGPAAGLMAAFYMGMFPFVLLDMAKAMMAGVIIIAGHRQGLNLKKSKWFQVSNHKQ